MEELPTVPITATQTEDICEIAEHLANLYSYPDQYTLPTKAAGPIFISTTSEIAMYLRTKTPNIQDAQRKTLVYMLFGAEKANEPEMKGYDINPNLKREDLQKVLEVIEKH